MYVCFINTEQTKERKRGMCRHNQCFSMILGEITRKTTKKSYFRPKSSKKLQKTHKQIHISTHTYLLSLVVVCC